MQKQLQQLKEFSTAYNAHMRGLPGIPNKDVTTLRVNLLKEELQELIQWIDAGNLNECADALADLDYVLKGTVYAFGLQGCFEQLFDEVHRSNMSKLGEDGKPIYREDNKVLKGPNYTPPRIADIINGHVAERRDLAALMGDGLPIGNAMQFYPDFVLYYSAEEPDNIIAVLRLEDAVLFKVGDRVQYVEAQNLGSYNIIGFSLYEGNIYINQHCLGAAKTKRIHEWIKLAPKNLTDKLAAIDKTTDAAHQRKSYETPNRTPVAMETTNDVVNHPKHYTDGKIEVIDFIEDKKLGFHLGNTVKYVARAGKKDPNKTIEDLEKAKWYLSRQIELLKQQNQE